MIRLYNNYSICYFISYLRDMKDSDIVMGDFA